MLSLASKNLAIPKSKMRTLPSRQRRTLPGFKSIRTTPRAWTCWMAAAIGENCRGFSWLQPPEGSNEVVKINAVEKIHRDVRVVAGYS